MVDNGVDTVSSTDQTATCPCKSKTSTPQTTTAVPSAAIDASALNQLVQSSSSPSTAVQPAAAYTPQYSAPQYTTTTVPVDVANVNTMTPTSAQNNAGTTEATGTAPTADFSNLFSQWINNEAGSNVPGYSLRNPTDQMFGIDPMYTANNQMAGSYPVYTANDQTIGVNPVYTGWQMSPINLVQAPVQANWLNGLMWF